ncbi:MAG: hypothetical protein RO469_15930 [Thermincola sp.]|jgi:hypothetical protein|nr:hypothetical protein [Thermincola sp.]MDT3704520.1 hypothetical protein [Thermincola sp.]
MKWIRIIIFVLKLIARGKTKGTAIGEAARTFGVSITEIKKKMG